MNILFKSQDSSLDSREKSKFAGLARKFESPIFVKNLGLMLDALEELSDLSLALQRADITLSVATKLISKQVLLFTARKESDSEYYTESCEAVASGEFQGVKLLTTAGNVPEIPKGQFYQALADSVAARLLPDEEKDLVRAIDALNPASFPDDLSPEYCESEIRLLCTKFGIAFRDLKFAFREYRDSRGNAIAPCVRVLLNCVNTIPVSTAECERGFSKMNVVCSSLRTRLTIPHVFTNVCVPVLSTRPAVGAIKICKIMDCTEQKVCRLYARTQTCCCPSSCEYCHESVVGCYVTLPHCTNWWCFICVIFTFVAGICTSYLLSE